MAAHTPTNRITETSASATSETLADAKQFVADHAIGTVAFCFGLGLGAGILLGVSLGEHPMRRRQRLFAERYGRQFLDSLSKVLPESLMPRS